MVQAGNKIILGTVQFGLNYGINNTLNKPNQYEVNKILSAAYASGIRCLDTAELYGDAHKIIGEFHKYNGSEIFNIITKLPHHVDESIELKIKKYLQELNVTCLEGLLFHSYKAYQDNKASIELLKSYKKKGKLKYLGVSVYTNEQAENVILDKDIDIIQLPFNLFDNLNLRGDILKKAKEHNKIVHTRSAFLQGLFFMSLDASNKITKLLNKELTLLHHISNESSLTMQKMALSYCLQQADIDNVLIGVDNINQLKQNLAEADFRLPESILNNINLINIDNPDLLNPSLWNQ